MKENHQTLRRLLLLGAVLLFIGGHFQALALDPDRSIYQYNCRTWRRANGLPANAVTAIAQTEDGRLWLGTSQGLVYFNGVEFRVFDLVGEKGIESKLINSLARRSGGGLWFGLERGSFGYFDGEQFHSLQRPEWGGPFATVHSVLETRDGRMLLGGTGLAGKLVNTNTMTSLLPTNNADVFSIYEDPRGRIWMGTAEHGLFYWENGRLTPFTDRTLQNLVVSAIVMDQVGKLWVGTASGLRCYETNFQLIPLPEFTSQPKALLVDRYGVVWIGTVNSGLIRYHDGAFTSLHKQDGLASDRILSLAESDDGSLWVGTEDGLSQLSDVKFPILTTTEGLVSEACLAVAASPKGGIWAGTPNGMSYYHDGAFTNFGVSGANGFRSRWVKRVFAASNGDVYCIGGRKNLDRFSGDQVVMSWTNSVWPRAVAEDSHGILVALAGDLMRIENDKLVPVRLADGKNVSLNWINDLLVARDDSIWVAAVGGVYQIKDGILHNWCQENGLSQSTFYYLCEDDDGDIWAAQNTGIARFKNGGLRQITRQQGLHENFVYAIVPDKLGNFWMDSNRGIFRVSQRELNAVADGTAERVQCSVYEGENAVKTTDKGAQDYSGCRSSDGRIWFPSSKGIIMIDPTNVPSNPLPPVVFIERVRINGQEYRLDQEPALEPGPGNLEFDYSALYYQAPQKIQYRYRLEGYDSRWVDAGNRRSAFYTNLKPGRYRFQVQACNADGVWNTAGTSFALKLPPRFDQTIAFRITCLVVALVFGAYAWWVWHLRRQHVQLQQTHALLESKVQERTSELRKEIEERKRAEEALEKSRWMLRTVLDTIPTRVFWKDVEGRYLGGNRPFASDAGLDSPEALLGKDDYAMGWKNQADLYRADDRQVITSGVPKFQYEEPQTTPAGTQLWLRTSKIPLRDLEGRIIGVLGAYEDVTEHKRAQERVMESEKYLNKIINSIADPIFVKDRQHHWVLLNDAFCDFMGHKRDELIGKSDHDFFPKGEADVFAVKDEIVFNAGMENTNEEEFTDSKGNTHTILTKKALYTDEKGEKFIVGIIRDITERKRAEETIIHERQLLRTLIDLLPETFFIKDLDGRFLVANEALAKHLGKKTPAQILGLSDADFFPAELAASFRAEEAKVLGGEPLIDQEGAGVSPVGRECTFLTTKVPFRDGQGRIQGLVGIGRDITERKRAEELLHYEQTLVATMMDNIPDAVYFKDTASRFLRANRALSRKFGVSDPAQLVGKSDAEFFSGEHARRALADEQKIIRTGQPLLDIEEKETWPDGTVGWVLTSKLPLRNAAGQVIGTCGISRDITERKRAEELLQRSHEEFKNLFDDAPVGFHEVDTGGRLVRINNTELKMLGYSAEELLGQFVWKISAEEETSRRAVLAKLGGEPPPESFERRLRRKDGSTFPALINDRILKGTNGAIVGIRSAIQDDTARQQAEEAMRLTEERLLRVITQTRCILNFGQVEGPAGWRERALNPESPFRWDCPVLNEETAQKIFPLELASGEQYQDAWFHAWNRADLGQMNWNAGNAFLNDLPFYRNEFRCTDKHGVGHWMQQFVTVRKLAENRWEAFCITTDISDLKRVETELRESQALYHSLVEQMPAGIFRKDAKGRYVFVNSTFCRLKEMSPNQFLGKTVLEVGLTDVALATKAASHHATIMQSGNQIEDDEVYSGADGGTRYYRAVKSPVFDSAGKIVGTQGVLFDITERKWAEEALRLSETQLQVILESTADGILAVDSTGKAVIKTNRRFAELWRIPQSLIDAGDNRAMLDFARKQLSDPDAYLNRTQSLYGTDKLGMDTLAFKDGRVFERYSFPMIMDGAVIGRVWSFRDVTGRKRQEKELSEKNSELERFTYTVSHDLKSPLVTVKTFLGYLEQDLTRPDKERVKQDVAYMHTAADKMGHLLDELLNLARVGRKMNPAERVTFKELAQEAVRLVAGRISTGGAEVQVAEAAVVLEGDRPRLMEIWQNLVENACKFMGNQPKPRVEIGVEQRGPEMVFFVRDNGAGIDPRYQDKVFGLFEKLDPKGEGTGMGLALVKRIVEMYKGRIWVESPGLGQGATFLFTLPGAVIIDPEQSS
ncbi:MAG: PAS domain S-box protein [Verrucomicrobiota bacterium]|jgi:PAS domain S-box-containing protein